ncbi:MAG: DUF4407 domain-containing protein [Alphaproteobacteria bacterium]|nr:DUF4407 domain-containing protein [Alphaproteobacteria bacterium]
MDQHNENSSPIDGDSYPLSHTFYDQQTKSSTIQKFLWKCAGADYKILDNATYSNQVKYTCIGGIVLSTGILAGLSGGFAFNSIFGNKIDITDTVESNSFLNSDWFWIQISIVFGILWGAMIFNLYKYIVFSTEKGDTTNKMTYKDFKNAIPKIIIGLVLAITISKPIELRIFKNKIDVKIIAHQQELNTIHKEFQAENRNKIKNSDGLLERMNIAKNIIPWDISFFITLLFTCLVLSPIGIKMTSK